MSGMRATRTVAWERSSVANARLPYCGAFGNQITENDARSALGSGRKRLTVSPLSTLVSGGCSGFGPRSWCRA